jgi:hypothetical protein
MQEAEEFIHVNTMRGLRQNYYIQIQKYEIVKILLLEMKTTD